MKFERERFEIYQCSSFPEAKFNWILFDKNNRKVAFGVDSSPSPEGVRKRINRIRKLIPTAQARFEP